MDSQCQHSQHTYIHTFKTTTISNISIILIIIYLQKLKAVKSVCCVLQKTFKDGAPISYHYLGEKSLTSLDAS